LSDESCGFLRIPFSISFESLAAFNGTSVAERLARKEPTVDESLPKTDVDYVLRFDSRGKYVVAIKSSGPDC